ncbi:reverse transcriptase domain-containing protein [Tanacetum coccineum]
MPLKKTTTPMTDDDIKQLIAQGVADALAEYEANKGSGNGDDSHDSRTGGRRQVPTTHEKTLTWWNSHVKTVSHEAAYGMTWKTLKKKMMTDNYTQRFQELALMCGRIFLEESDEVEKYVGGLPDNIQGSVMASKPKTMQDAIEIINELMDQKVRAYAERQAENKRKLNNNNQDQQQPPKKQSVAISYTAGSGEKKEYVGTLPLCNKCKFHHNGPCTVKCANRKRVGHLTRDYRSPASTNNQRTLTYYECGNQGHYRSDCPEIKNQNHENQAGGTEARGMLSPAATNNSRTLTCYECENQGYYRSDCLELKNQNHGNQAGDLPQLLDSKRGSHVINFLAFDVDDFTSWKDRFLFYLDGLEPYLLDILENGPFAPKSLASTSKNILIKPLKQCHERPSNTRDTKVASLILKFNAFKALEGKKVKDSDSDIEEDTRSNSEFLADLNAEFHNRPLLENQKRTLSKRLSTSKTSSLSYLSSNKNYNKPKFHTKSSSSQQHNQITDNSQKDYIGKYKALKAELAIFTKKIDVVAKNKSEKGGKPIGKSNDVIPLADLTKTLFVSDKIKHVTKKESSIKAIKKKAQTKSPYVPNPSSSKSIKGKQKTRFRSCKHCRFKNHLLEDCYNKAKCSTCQSTDHLTKEHPEQVVVKNTLAKLKAHSSLATSSRKAFKIPKSFIPFKYCGFNDHHSDEYEYYLVTNICGSIAHEPANCD